MTASRANVKTAVAFCTSLTMGICTPWPRAYWYHRLQAEQDLNRSGGIFRLHKNALYYVCAPIIPSITFHHGWILLARCRILHLLWLSILVLTLSLVLVFGSY